MADSRVTNLLAGFLPLFALLAGCRCENLGASDCASSDRCRAISIREADPVRECRGDKKFIRCEPREEGVPSLSNIQLLHDEEGRYWLGDPEELPGSEVQDMPDAVHWGLCAPAEGASVPLPVDDGGE